MSDSKMARVIQTLKERGLGVPSDDVLATAGLDVSAPNRALVRQARHYVRLVTGDGYERQLREATAAKLRLEAELAKARLAAERAAAGEAAARAALDRLYGILHAHRAAFVVKLGEGERVFLKGLAEAREGATD